MKNVKFFYVRVLIFVHVTAIISSRVRKGGVTYQQIIVIIPCRKKWDVNNEIC
nr:MAG TPA: hypothetical protein [Caudoviricetes sp.]